MTGTGGFNQKVERLRINEVLRTSREDNLRRSLDFHILSSKKRYRADIDKGGFLREDYKKVGVEAHRRSLYM
jgi:hypothetical protein